MLSSKLARSRLQRLSIPQRNLRLSHMHFQMCLYLDISFVYFFTYFVTSGLVPTKLIFPPDVKIETTFFQRKFFSTTPCNYPQKQHKKRTSDLSEVPILRCFLKILPPSVPLPASYQIPPDCILNGIYPSNDMSFLYPIRTFSISFAALAHC